MRSYWLVLLTAALLPACGDGMTTRDEILAMMPETVAGMPRTACWWGVWNDPFAGVVQGVCVYAGVVDNETLKDMGRTEADPGPPNPEALDHDCTLSIAVVDGALAWRSTVSRRREPGAAGGCKVHTPFQSPLSTPPTHEELELMTDASNRGCSDPAEVFPPRPGATWGELGGYEWWWDTTIPAPVD